MSIHVLCLLAAVNLVIFGHLFCLTGLEESPCFSFLKEVSEWVKYYLVYQIWSGIYLVNDFFFFFNILGRGRGALF